jgi:hypothetical protein
MKIKITVSLVLCFLTTALLAQPAVVVTDTTKQPERTIQPKTQDRVTMIDGSVLLGQIREVSATRVLMNVSGSDIVLEPQKIERIERNVPIAAEEPKAAEILTKDGQRYRGTVKRSDAQNTYIASAAGDVAVKNDNIQEIRFLDADKARQQDALAARPGRWELSLKGGSPFYQLGTFKDLLAPGYMGFLQVEAPYFMLPGQIRLGGGLMAGYARSTGKNDTSTRLELFPGFFSLGVARQLGQTSLDVYAQGLVGVNLTRGIIAGGPERLALDLAYGSELGLKYYITTNLTVRLAGMWFAVSESNATLNHLGAYAAVGWAF